MTRVENFVSRWSRLKNESVTESPTAPAADVASDDAAGGAGEQPQGNSGEDGNLAAETAFDPASLPSIESIDVGTDIRGFLQPRVPPELRHAALRRAWSSDPAIRDFIGIAENQWDFNDPATIFGFGPMKATDNIPMLLAQALGHLETLAETTVANIRQPPAVRTEGREPELPVDQPTTLENGAADRLREHGTIADIEISTQATADDSTPIHGRHGSALPR